jgi:hypothetical protein
LKDSLFYRQADLVLDILPLLAELNHARDELIKNLKSGFTEREKQFIISVKSKKPKWDLIEINHIKDLPAVKLKLLNLEKMD